LGLISGAGRGHGFFIESESLSGLLCSSLLVVAATICNGGVSLSCFNG